MNFITKFLIGVASTSFLFACQAKVKENSPSVVLPGLLDLPVLKNSFIPADCMLETIGLEKAEFIDCIAFLAKSEGIDGKDWDSEYIAELTKLGWKFAGGEANVFYLEKPINKTCSTRLNMVGWIIGDKDEIRKYKKSEKNIDWSKIPYGSFIFMIEQEPVCNDKRYLR
jgi:hypothetical protein